MSTGSALEFLRDRRALRRLGAIALACVIGGALYAELAPRWYRATLTVMPTRAPRGGGNLAAMLGGDLGGLAAGLAEGAGGFGGGSDIQRIAAVLQSAAVSDAVVDRFQLKEAYRARYREAAREELWKHCDVKTLPKPNLVQLSCEDRDPRRAQQMVEFFADHGNQVFRRVGVSTASEQVRFLEKRVQELRAQADQTAARMREFQEKYQIVDIETQTKAVVGAIAALNSQRINKQLELDYARTYAASDEATARQLEAQLQVFEQKLRRMEDGAPAAQGQAGGRGGLFPAALSVPKLRAEYEGLFRDRKVSEATLVFALERLESARADEARDTSTFQVLDPPTVPERRARPRRLTALLAGALLGVVAGAAYEWVRRGGLRAALGRMGLGWQ